MSRIQKLIAPTTFVFDVLNVAGRTVRFIAGNQDSFCAALQQSVVTRAARTARCGPIDWIKRLVTART